MSKDNKKIFNLFLRYTTILLLSISNLYIFYKILIPLTLHTTNIIIKIFTPTTILKNTIHFNQTTIQIIQPCVAGSAFYLLLILLLSTANIKPLVRTKAIATALIAFFILNISRILLLSTITKLPSFETIHFIFWHIVSTIFVVATYLSTIKFYKIKSIPIYTDLKYLNSLTKIKKNPHNHNKNIKKIKP